MSEVTPRSKSSYILPIISASIGNMVEWADWSIYGLTATFIAANFFPAADPTVALLQAFAVFAIGFIIRPVGSMVLGPYGDKYGPKQSSVMVYNHNGARNWCNCDYSDIQSNWYLGSYRSYCCQISPGICSRR